MKQDCFTKQSKSIRLLSKICEGESSMYHEFFPEEFIQLQLEIEHHPLLIQRLQKHPQMEIELIFAEVAFYCGFSIDGTYNAEQLRDLSAHFLEELKKKKSQSAIKANSDNWVKEAWKFGVH